MKMKTVLALVFLIASGFASVVPKQSSEVVDARQARFITANIEQEIDDFAQYLRDEGYDPFHIEQEQYIDELPVPIIFSGKAFLEQVWSHGLSNIVVHRMSLIANLLYFEIELPHVDLSARVANASLTVFGNTLAVESDGRIDVRGIYIDGRIRVYPGVISGVQIRGVRIDFNPGRITSNIRLAIQGENYSREINEFITVTIPAILEEYSEEMNELIEILLWEFLDENL